jgi:hypothetical protein
VTHKDEPVQRVHLFRAEPDRDTDNLAIVFFRKIDLTTTQASVNREPMELSEEGRIASGQDASKGIYT